MGIHYLLLHSQNNTFANEQTPSQCLNPPSPRPRRLSCLTAQTRASKSAISPSSSKKTSRLVQPWSRSSTLVSVTPTFTSFKTTGLSRLPDPALLVTKALVKLLPSPTTPRPSLRLATESASNGLLPAATSASSAWPVTSPSAPMFSARA